MLRYADCTHAAILNAIENQLPEQDDCMPIDALRKEVEATEARRPIPTPGTYFPGRHGITELGY